MLEWLHAIFSRTGSGGRQGACGKDQAAVFWLRSFQQASIDAGSGLVSYSAGTAATAPKLNIAIQRDARWSAGSQDAIALSDDTASSSATICSALCGGSLHELRIHGVLQCASPWRCGGLKSARSRRANWTLITNQPRSASRLLGMGVNREYATHGDNASSSDYRSTRKSGCNERSHWHIASVSRHVLWSLRVLSFCIDHGKFQR